MPIVNRIADFHTEKAEWRYRIHAHPETAFVLRRIFLVAASSDDGLLTERRTAAQPWRRELVFMPRCSPSPM